MVSAKVSNAKLQTMEKKTFKPISILKSLFHIDKKKEKPKETIDKQNKSKITIDKADKENTKKNESSHNADNTVAAILEPFKKLELHIKVNQEDELDNFTFKVIEDDRRSIRIDSQSSEDSGFAEHNDVVETLEKLTLHEEEESNHTDTNDRPLLEELNQRETKDRTLDEEELNQRETKDRTLDDEELNQRETKETKKKKKRKVIVSRAPIRSKVCDSVVHPYVKDTSSIPINQINKQTLSGGQVIVNPTPETCELDTALQNVAKIYNSDPIFWEDVLDVITRDETDVLSEFPQITDNNQFQIDIVPENIEIPNPIEEFSTTQHIPSFDESLELSNSIFQFDSHKNDSHIFPTPPRSENVPSPLSESHTFYASNSEYTLSPERSSPIYNSDFEKYQVVSPLSYESSEEKELKRDSDRASQMSLSSMTMKNFKDLQKEIANEFSKKECCDFNRKATLELLEEHLKKLTALERKNICMSVSRLDIKTAYGVLHNILLCLSKECEQDSLQYAFFALVCQRVLAQSPALFVGEFGLSILKAAALRCPHRPLLTRHIVHCVYLVLRNDPKLCINECVFHEVDAQCDNLVIACARGGDAYALVLAEITRNDSRGELPPLFKLHHTNADGYTALHVACRQHGPNNPHLQTVHALLDHAQSDLWKGDIKGGDTALHLAVNSSTCELRLVVTLFKHLDRKLWKKLAHAQNMSSVTPLEYARSAVKSTTRKSYPTEVLDFLKKCR